MLAQHTLAKSIIFLQYSYLSNWSKIRTTSCYKTAKTQYKMSNNKVVNNC